jgi:hypothetical protein
MTESGAQVGSRAQTLRLRRSELPATFSFRLPRSSVRYSSLISKSRLATIDKRLTNYQMWTLHLLDKATFALVMFETSSSESSWRDRERRRGLLLQLHGLNSDL